MRRLDKSIALITFSFLLAATLGACSPPFTLTPYSIPQSPASSAISTPTSPASPLSQATSLKTVGYITHWQVNHLPQVKIEFLTHLIWQSVQVSSDSDPTLRVTDNYPWSQISEVVNPAHARGVKVLASLGGPWNDPDLNRIWKSSSLRADLITNLKNLVLDYNLDGIDIDNESSPDPYLYSTFITELYQALNPLGKIISMAGAPTSVGINTGAAAYLDFISLMTYDMSGTKGFPYHSTYDESVMAMNLWAKAGFPREKLLMGIPFYGRDSGGGFYYYSWLVKRFNPTQEQNQAAEPTAVGGIIWWNGIKLVEEKVKYVKNEGFGGVMMYEISIDASDNRSLLLAISNQVKEFPSVPNQYNGGK